MFRRTLSKKIQTVLTLFFILEFFVTSTSPAEAFFGFDIDSTIDFSEIAKKIAIDMEKRYNLNLGSLRNQSQLLNVSGNKQPVPEVSLFFTPSDPKEGAKISAKAFPIYFTNPEGALYYTWYLKRAGSSNKVETWKIEAARILAQNGYDKVEAEADYDATFNDGDGYKAKYGGDNKTNAPDYCYVNDPISGTNYELTRGEAGDVSFGCDTTTVCMVTSEGSDGQCSTDSAPPTCASGVTTCSIGDLRCVADINSTTCADFTVPSNTGCSVTTASDMGRSCKHLFPKTPASGNGSFGASEEEFWGTDPNDPDTADNGNKDEANVVGLGQSTFTWNYVAGDQVGVAVEGTSMIPTKHADSSYMIMWAFPKKDCPVGDTTGEYTKTIKDYIVTIPTSSMDLNDCIEKNLVDPAQGGQATKLEVSVSATPDNPVNDPTGDKSGDMVTAQASLSNAQHNLTDILFDWTVEINDNIANFDDDEKDITADLRTRGLLGNTRGNALDSIKVKLDLPESITDDFLNDSGIWYLRFKVAATENFSGSSVRKGKSDIIVKFISTDEKISAYQAQTQLDSTSPPATMKVILPSTSICNTSAERSVCSVLKNEIIGLKAPSTLGLSNFYWTINGSSLICSKKVSGSCSDTAQNDINFFPVTGNVGDVYTVMVTANDVTSGKTMTLSRTFRIVQPQISIQSANEALAWPKFLGQYRDITGTAGCDGNLCTDSSDSIFEALAGSTLQFEASFTPSSLSDTPREWMVDGASVTPATDGTISFVADKPAGSIYTIGLTANRVSSDEMRRALFDIWNISPFDSTEIVLADTNQVELLRSDIVAGAFPGERKYLAAIVSYIPASILFTFRIVLSAVLILFVAHFLYSLLQDRRTNTLVE